MPLEGQKGEDILNGVVKLLEDFGVADRLVAMSFDTTSSNTGKHQGACIRLEKFKEKALLWLACRRHILELHVKHVSEAVAKEVSDRSTTGPSNTLFKRLQDNWADTLPLIDLSDLNKFD